VNEPHELRFARPGTPTSPESAFDIRTAAISYSNISALLAGFAFTAITLVIAVFAERQTVHPVHDEIRAIEFAVGLFGIAFVSNTMGAFAYGALSGGQTLTPRLIGASYLQGVTAAIGACSVFAGTCVLVGQFLPSRLITVFFGAATFGVGAAAVFLLSWNASDTLRTCGPPNLLRYPQSPEIGATLGVVEQQETRHLVTALGILGVLSAPAFLVPIDRNVAALQETWVVLGGLAAVMMCLVSIWYSNPHGQTDGRLSWRTSLTIQIALATYVSCLLNLLPIQLY
jgi:hypothetical protein